MTIRTAVLLGVLFGLAFLTCLWGWWLFLVLLVKMFGPIQ